LLFYEFINFAFIWDLDDEIWDLKLIFLCALSVLCGDYFWGGLNALS